MPIRAPNLLALSSWAGKCIPDAPRYTVITGVNTLSLTIPEFTECIVVTKRPAVLSPWSVGYRSPHGTFCPFARKTVL